MKIVRKKNVHRRSSGATSAAISGKKSTSAARMSQPGMVSEKSGRDLHVHAGMVPTSDESREGIRSSPLVRDT